MELKNKETFSAEAEYQRWLSNLTSANYSDELLKYTCTKEQRLSLLDSARYCDVTLECQGQNLQCHKTILVENSVVMDTMFSSGFKEGTEQAPIEIKDIIFDLLKAVVRFLYSGDIELSGETVMSILEFADMYEIEPLRITCGKFLMSSINPTVAVFLWQRGMRYRASKLTNDAKKYILDNFSDSTPARDPQIALTMGFLESNETELIEILADPSLNVPKESNVFDAILDWAIFDVSQRENVLGGILEKCVRHPAVNSDTVSQKIKIVARDKLSPCMGNALLQFIVKTTQSNTFDHFIPNRTKTQQSDMLVVKVGHIDDGYAPGKCTLQMCFKSASELKFEKQIKMSCHGRCSIVCHKEKLYATANSKQISVFNMATQKEQIFSIDASHSIGTLVILPDGRIVNVSRTDGYLCCEEIDTATWSGKHAIKSSIQIQDLAKYAIYDNDILFFNTKANVVIKYNTVGQTFSVHDLRFPNNKIEYKVASFRNIACFVSSKSVCILYLDEFIEQTGWKPCNIDRNNTCEDDQLNSMNTLFHNVDLQGEIGQIYDATIFENEIVCLTKIEGNYSKHNLTFRTVPLQQLLDKDAAIRWNTHKIEGLKFERDNNGHVKWQLKTITCPNFRK